MSASQEKYSDDLKPHDQLDWDTLRQQSVAPGGFGSSRAYIWPRLLHTGVDSIQSKESPGSLDDSDPHPDERQIRLDTDRSFVLYPVDDGPEHVRIARQTKLNKLIVQVFRRHPGLNYFQGFHDIATVFLLTLPPEVTLPALEKLSLHRLRDSMGHTLEPLNGLMVLLQRLLRLADPPYAALLEEHAPLPYAALPHLLTLFAHAAPTLPLIQHIFDYLLARPPLSIVYLVAAVTLNRKDEVLKLGESGEDGMIHSVLTGLPELIDQGHTETEDDSQGDEAQAQPEPAVQAAERSNHTPAPDDSPPAYSDSERGRNSSEAQQGQQQQPAGAPQPQLGAPAPSPESPAAPAAPTHTDTKTGALSRPPPPPPRDERTDAADDDIPPSPQPAESPVPPSHPPPTSPSDPVASNSPDRDPAEIPLPPSTSSTRPASPAPSRAPRARKVPLAVILALADQLFARFPPTEPELHLADTLGPGSAMRTWSQDPALLLSDDTAEALVVEDVDIVVRPPPEPEPEVDKPRPRRGRAGRRRRGRTERRAMLVGAVLVLGIAVAYGVHARRGGGFSMSSVARAGKTVLGMVGVLGERVFGALGGEGGVQGLWL
ncbi:rab-GTPase-TBC domain-containing protein [Gloeopeniophorella convolvens]|nr:rab-GTPase-TBC domain-containing protein [Gloeopeniophorella convolvens]